MASKMGRRKKTEEKRLNHSELILGNQFKTKFEQQYSHNIFLKVRFL